MIAGGTPSAQDGFAAYCKYYDENQKRIRKETKMTTLTDADVERVMIYQFTIIGTAANGQTWRTTGKVSCEFNACFDTAMRASFEQLTGGKAVFGKPGVGCSGPYDITSILIQQVSATPDEKDVAISELQAIVQGFLDCPEIADCAPDDKDPETDDLERRARCALKGQTK